MEKLNEFADTTFQFGESLFKRFLNKGGDEAAAADDDSKKKD
jgi:hypothetical protein